jgi:MoxR-like ATPase
MKFERVLFNPEARATTPEVPGLPPRPGGDRRDGALYVYGEEIILAVNAALATERPLLIEGPPGSGKSSLAPHIARVLGWWYYEQVITSRTSAQDLLWEFDALRRLNDAQVEKDLQPREAYVEPGVLWWAFDPESARQRGRAKPPDSPLADPGRPGTRPEAVVLLDEIDKAEPDVPNDLLVPLGSREFRVKESGARIEARRKFLLIITSNGERDLAPAFIRRCIRLVLPHHDVRRLVEIASAHFGAEHEALYRQLAEWVAEARHTARRRAQREPGTAEFLDAVRACLQLGITPDAVAWESLSRMVLSKAGPDGTGAT